MNAEPAGQIKGMDELLYRQRHSAAHILAEAVLGLAGKSTGMRRSTRSKVRWCVRAYCSRSMLGMEHSTDPKLTSLAKTQSIGRGS
jgi:hypothetical protein